MRGSQCFEVLDGDWLLGGATSIDDLKLYHIGFRGHPVALAALLARALATFPLASYRLLRLASSKFRPCVSLLPD